MDGSPPPACPPAQAEDRAYPLALCGDRREGGPETTQRASHGPHGTQRLGVLPSADAPGEPVDVPFERSRVRSLRTRPPVDTLSDGAEIPPAASRRDPVSGARPHCD